MRQPARQLPYRFQFLAVQQRLFQPLTLRSVDLHLGGLFFQQAGGALQRRRIAGKNVKRARQFPQLVPPLQGRDADIRFAVRQPGHGARNRRQVRTEVAVDIPPGKAGNHHRQQGEGHDKQRAGAQFLMALRHPLF